MSDSIYTITRETASANLGVSTRTIDRYIKSWKLTYKKIANKVLLSQSELAALKDEFNSLHQNTVSSEILWNHDVEEMQVTSPRSAMVSWALSQVLDQKIDKFFELVHEKEQQVEEKNRVIFMLQQRIGELEGKLQHMVALPEYNQEKQLTILEKEKLEDKVKELTTGLKSEKIKNIFYIIVIVVVVLVLLMLTRKS